jgi:hypothetical protein
MMVMKRSLMMVFVVLTNMMLFHDLDAQSSSYRLYKFNDGVIIGYHSVTLDSIPEKPLKSIKKAIRRNLFEDETPVVYANSSTGKYGVSFINKNYELNYIIISNTGNVEHTIVFINPEFDEFSAISDEISNLGYSFNAIDSPFGPVRKNISPSKTWFEVYPGKQGNADFEMVLILNSKFKQIAIEKNE